MTRRRRDRRIKVIKPIHHCSICDREPVDVCGDVCDVCLSRGITRRFQDRERINPAIFEWMEHGKNHQKGGR